MNKKMNKHHNPDAQKHEEVNDNSRPVPLDDKKFLVSYSFNALKKYLDENLENHEKIKFLIEARTRYLQDDYAIDEGRIPFDKKCDVEIEKLKSLIEIESNSKKIKMSTTYKLSDKRGALIDLIRVLNALYELRFIQKSNGIFPTKKEFMEDFGKFLGVDLSEYHANLSQALQEQTLETNLKVFKMMIEFTENEHYTTKNNH